MSLSILRRPELERRLGMPRSSIYLAIQRGLLTRPIPVSTQARGWPSVEIDRIVAARVAGKTEDEIKQLVVRLTAARSSYTEVAA